MTLLFNLHSSLSSELCMPTLTAGQFVDHHWTPVAPLSASDGVSSVTSDGEVYLGLPSRWCVHMHFIVVSGVP